MSSSGCTLYAEWVLKINYVRGEPGSVQNPFTKNLALVSTLTPALVSVPSNNRISNVGFNFLLSFKCSAQQINNLSFQLLLRKNLRAFLIDSFAYLSFKQRKCKRDFARKFHSR